jgi:hypothetical protein
MYVLSLCLCVCVVFRSLCVGVVVRMVTGDNLNTATAIARECGILTQDGMVLEGPAFRAMTPSMVCPLVLSSLLPILDMIICGCVTYVQVDAILPRLQVLARSSPEDKYLLVVRLNGRNLPNDREEWEMQHRGKAWDADRDLLLPGYR